MELKTAYERIAALLHEVDDKHSALDAAAIRGRHLTQDLGLDSLDVIKFVLLVEESFDIKIADEEIDQKELLKVDNLAAYVAGRAG